MAAGPHVWSPGSSSPELVNLTGPSSEAGDVPHDDVAIIGMACRTAGGNDTPEKLWQFLLERRVASGEVPAWRWEPWARRDARNAGEMAQTQRRGYFVEELEHFDARFFGISPKEAEQMDPHQRLALELSWEALEQGGVDAKALAGTDTAVYMGVDSDDYARLLLEDLGGIEAWMGIGTAAHGVANRVSYHLGLMGASAAVDAACASSLVAVHLARQALLAGEARLALAGGVNVLLAPALTRMLGKAGALSPAGVCRSLDAGADGYARGEGGAVVVLKRLGDARRDGDRVLAVLRGSAVAQDGKTNGIMAPNAAAQERVARRALAVAGGMDARSVGYVEAHATATPLGDPTEMAAIAAVYGAACGRPLDQPLLVGSIKPNVGHLEAAAGAIGLVKAVLAVHKGQVAPQALLERPNPRVDWAGAGLRVVQEAARWTGVDGGPRRAAVCSYGYGGTVSHAILEEHRWDGPREGEGDGEAAEAADVILVLSSAQEKRLALQAASLAAWLATEEGRAADLRAVANTLAQRRAQHEYRAAFVVRDRDEAVRVLSEFGGKPAAAQGHPGALPPAVAQGRVIDDGAPASCVWVFSGHGAQWRDMGRELLGHAVFARAVARLEPVVQREMGFSAAEALRGGDFDASERVQVLTYVMQVGLSAVLAARGLRPQAVLGHSVGEIAAAVAAGCLSEAEGAVVVCRRARLYARARDERPGGMALVQLPFDQVEGELGRSRRDAEEVLVAAIDASPASCVVSGDAAAVDAYVEALRGRGVRAFRVPTDVAFHSPALDAIADPLRAALAGDALRPAPPRLPLYSTSSPDPRAADPRDAAYWLRNTLGPVRLRAAVQAAADDGHRVFLEVATHPIVRHSLDETLAVHLGESGDFATAATMRRDAPASRSLQAAVAELFVRGAAVDWAAQLGPRRRWCPSVPGTPWVRQPYYRQVQTVPLAQDTVSRHNPAAHTLLGRRVAVAGTETIVFATTLDTASKPFPGTHPLAGTEIVPAAVYLHTFHRATGARRLADIRLRVPVAMSAETRRLQVVVRGDALSVASSAIRDGGGDDDDDDDTWVAHSSACWSAEPPESPPPLDVDAVRRRIGTRLPDSFAVDYLARIGVEGVAFPWRVLEHYGSAREMLARVDVDPSVADGDPLPWDPDSWAPLLDAATSVGSTLFAAAPKLRIVSQIAGVELYPQTQDLPKVAYLFVEQAAPADSDDGPASHVSVLRDDGAVLARIRGMRFAEVEATAESAGGVDRLVHRLAWVPPRFAERPRPLHQVVLVAPDRDVREAYEAQLASTARTLVAVASVDELAARLRESDPDADPDLRAALGRRGSALVYVPGRVEAVDDVAAAAEQFVWAATSLVRLVVAHRLESSCRVFVVAHRVFAADSATALAHGALYGLARILAAEHPDVWGALLDAEDPRVFPLLAAKYVHGHDVLRIVDGLPRRALLRPLSPDLRYPDRSASSASMRPRPEGTYLITGGLGALGLETARFLVDKGARRLVLVSRRGLPPRRTWADRAAADPAFAHVVDTLLELERRGASVHALALDVARPDAARALLAALDALGLPPVRGFVHAAGLLEDGLALDTPADSFARVLAPKVRGGLALHAAFPPASVDFAVLYSSIGQLVGTAGQASYAAGNAFLDALAAHRRRTPGDRTVALQFTAWRGRGMGASTAFLAAELRSKGITDISRDEAFRAWEHVAQYDVDGAVVTRCRAVDDAAAIAVPPLLEEALVRAQPAGTTTAAAAKEPEGPAAASPAAAAAAGPPSDRRELEAWVAARLRECVAAVLLMADVGDVDPRTPLADLGVDSVMTVALRQRLQAVLRVPVPPTLTWNHPTVSHLVPWFVAKLTDSPE